MQTKNKIQRWDYYYALILGLIAGIFLLPAENNLVSMHSLFLKFGTLFAMPLVGLSIVFLAKVLVYRLHGPWQFSKFILVAIANTAINIGVFNYLIIVTDVHSGFGLSLIAAVAFLAAVVHSYIWSTHWTFNEHRDHSPAEFDRFVLVTLSALFANSFIIFFLSNALLYMNNSFTIEASLINLIALIFSTVWNFFGYKYLVFKRNYH